MSLATGRMSTAGFEVKGNSCCSMSDAVHAICVRQWQQSCIGALCSIGLICAGQGGRRQQEMLAMPFYLKRRLETWPNPHWPAPHNLHDS